MNLSDFFSSKQKNVLEALKPLSERRLYVGDKRFGDERMVNVVKNLSAESLITFLNQTNQQIVRGLLVDREIYFWDADLAIHSEVATALGLVYDPSMRIHVYDFNGRDDMAIIDLESHQYPDMPAMNKLLASDKLIFFNGEDYVTGDTLIAS